METSSDKRQPDVVWVLIVIIFFERWSRPPASPQVDLLGKTTRLSGENVPGEPYCIHGPTNTIPIRQSHLLWPVSGLTSDLFRLPMRKTHSGFRNRLHGEPCACLPLRGQHTLALSPQIARSNASCFPFNCPSEPTGEHQNGFSLGDD